MASHSIGDFASERPRGGEIHEELPWREGRELHRGLPRTPAEVARSAFEGGRGGDSRGVERIYRIERRSASALSAPPARAEPQPSPPAAATLSTQRPPVRPPPAALRVPVSPARSRQNFRSCLSRTAGVWTQENSA